MIKRIYPRMSTADFVAKAIAIHGDLYDYSESVYDGLKEPFSFGCKRCGTTRTLTMASTHIRKIRPGGCKPCNHDRLSPCKICGVGVSSKVYHKTAHKCNECFQEYKRSVSDEWVLLVKREIRKNLQFNRWERKCRGALSSFYVRKRNIDMKSQVLFETWEKKIKNQIHRQLEDKRYSAWEMKCKNAVKQLKLRKIKSIPTEQY